LQDDTYTIDPVAFLQGENPTLALNLSGIFLANLSFAQLEELDWALEPWEHRIKQAFGDFVSKIFLILLWNMSMLILV
jgi:hypothetical protein